ncbi:MAG: GGDEF domain-containing protein [Cetobacterium sp.]|uniref:GGDEF domain-containing protein n=1 Tax=Cetobacterium sp. TaxID=2071632 RepID=UPI003EE7D71B
MSNYFKVCFLILFSLILRINIFSSDEVFYLGIQNTPETKAKINGKTINDIFIDMFKNDLKLNLKTIDGNWRESYENLEDGKIGALGLVTKNNLKKENIVFSNPIFNENIYIASDNIKLKSPLDLTNQNIYAYKGDTFPIKKLQEFLKRNDISAKIVEVDNIDDYRDELYLDSEFIAVRSQNRLLISYLAPICIGVNKKYEYLIPEINRSLDKKYGKEILNYMNNLPLYYQRDHFTKSLTSEEKEWLKNKSKLIIALDNETTLSQYSKGKNALIGILPAYTNKISSIINKPIEFSTHKNNDWKESFKNLKNNKIDFLVDSIEEKNLQGIYFSNAIDYIPLYLMTHVGTTNSKVGIVSGKSSKKLAEEHFPQEDIMTYSTGKELFNAFRKYQVGYIITPYLSYDDACHKDHKDVKIKDIPINFIVSKDNIILKNILNKAINVIGDIDKETIKTTVQSEKEKDLALEKEMNKRKKLFLLSITLVVLILLLKIRTEKKLATALKYDQLTTLQNRYLFNKVCSKRNSSTGVVAVIDLDNFKKANDKYGHQVGDLILIEVGKILLSVFNKKDCFRISGDEFYVYYTGPNFVKKLNQLIVIGQTSSLLKKYDITFSLGYYEKKSSETLESAFDKGDKAMYKAKKISGFSFSK